MIWARMPLELLSVISLNSEPSCAFPKSVISTRFKLCAWIGSGINDITKLMRAGNQNKLRVRYFIHWPECSSARKNPDPKIKLKASRASNEFTRMCTFGGWDRNRNIELAIPAVIPIVFRSCESICCGECCWAWRYCLGLQAVLARRLLLL